ncbi:hypothetical protein JW721_02135 [Candidatus Micrarchaeota archaeon]|nr:hypothetical protein [Candidatus Micrarchaeota archaeon]
MAKSCKRTMKMQGRAPAPPSPKSLSEKLREFDSKPSPSKLRAKEIQGEFSSFADYLLKKNILWKCGSELIISDWESMGKFCNKNVLPLTTKLAEEGIHVSLSFTSNRMLSSDIFHRASMGGPGEAMFSRDSTEECPVFFGANTSFSRISREAEASLPVAGTGEHVRQGAYSKERICVFADTIRNTVEHKLETVVSAPKAPRMHALEYACGFLRNHAYFSARKMGAGKLINNRAYDTLLHEGAHMELCRHGYFPMEFHELFAFSFSLAHAKAPRILLSIISDAHAHECGTIDHRVAAGNFFAMLKPLLAGADEASGKFPRMIAGFANMRAGEIRKAANKLISRLCAKHAISLEAMRENILEQAEKAVFG